MKRSRILAVDDNPTNLAVVEEIVAPAHTLETASCGEQALEVARWFRPDIVLLDITMPGVDGYEVCRRFRQEPTLASTKIIVVSARALLTNRLDAYEAGADDYLTKPFDEAELLSKIRVFQRLKTAEEVALLKHRVLEQLADRIESPLDGIREPARMLTNDAVTSKTEIVRLAQLILANVKRLRVFSRRVKWLSDIRTGRWSPTPGETRLSTLVDDAVEAIGATAGEKRVTVNVVVESDESVTVDLVGLRASLDAVLENAVRYSSPGDTVEVNVFRDGDYACVSVRDHGPGITPDRLPRVFEEFHDSDDEPIGSRQKLGLALVRTIVQEHDGRVSVASEPGKGSTFVLSLRPATEVKAADRAAVEATDRVVSG